MAYNNPYGQNPYGQQPPGQPPAHRAPPRQGIIGRGANALIGVTAEAIASRKQKNAAPSTYNERLTAPPTYDNAAAGSSSPSRSRSPSAREQKPRDGSYPPEKGRSLDHQDDDSSFDEDEEDRDLDEAAQELGDIRVPGVHKPPPTGNIASPAAIDTLVKSFLQQFPPPRQPIGPLQLPVILPQRRPRNKQRGFVKGYAPLLQEAGISQEVFLSFFEYFEEAIKVSPIFDIINVGVNIAGFVPEPTVQIVTTVVWIADVTAKEMYQRSRSNDFLGQMNERWFKPHGLFCMIVVYKPEEPEHLGESVNVSTGATTGISAPIPQPTSSKRFRTASAKTLGDAGMPEPAPLIFPQLDQWAASGGDTSKSKTGFMRDYFDRRAQQSFASENPNAVIAANPNFASKMADPSYQAQFTRPSRMLMSAIGSSRSDGQPGRIQQAEANRQEYRSYKQDRRADRRRARGPGLIGGVIGGATQLATGKKRDPGERMTPLSMIRKVMRQDALYLMIAPLPNHQERASVGKSMEDTGFANASRSMEKDPYGPPPGAGGMPMDAPPPAYDDVAGGPSASRGPFMSGGPPMGDKKY
ncbi:MAG: hypothetical protein M1828_004859 [Chrysothrix sp. TS-e1954]|nr:MAG: hypothetical protein M1828_004859 [Chrysothrix sp. TS-e1954]